MRSGFCLLFAGCLSVALAEAPPVPLGQREGLDRGDAQRVDADPTSGQLRYRHVDLTLGAGDRALELNRTYRPWSGSPQAFGLHWASVLTARLQPVGTSSYAFHDAEGLTRLFVADDATPNTFLATHGRLSSLTQDPNGFSLRGLGDERHYRFDRQGNLIRIEVGGARHHLHRDGGGALTGVSGPWGELRVERDPRGGIAALVAPGRAVRYAYDGLLLTEADFGGRLLAYGYTPDGLLDDLADGQARVLYDSLGRVVRLYGAVETTRLSYLERSDALEVEVERRGQRTTVLTSAREVVRTPADAPLAAQTERYDDRGLLSELEGPEGSERLVYDELGRLIRVETPNGATELSYADAAAERPHTVRAPNGAVSSFRYDDAGRLRSAKLPGAEAQLFSYDGEGRLRAMRDGRGSLTRYAYDEHDRVIAVLEPGEGTTRFEHDAAGRVRAIVEAGGRRVDLIRDDWGRVTAARDADGQVFACSYDSRGLLTQETDELGHTVRYRYDDAGRLLESTDEVGSLGRFSYDASGRLAAITDAAGAAITYSRPAANTLVVSDPVRGERTLRFDAAGRLERETRAGVELGYRYDAHGRLVARTTPAGEERFAYDASGRLTESLGPAGGYRFAYDAEGRLASLTDANLDQTLRYRYDANGERSALELPWGTVRYERDAAGQVTAVVLPDEGRIEIELDARGRRTQIRYPNGVESSFRYTGEQLSEVVTQRGDALLDRRAYGYDARGRVSWTEDPQGRTAYEHDARGRLLRAKGPAGEQRFRYDAANARAVAESHTLETNTRGELVTWNQVELDYDHDGHLTQSTTATGTTRFGYSPLGTRLWRERDGEREFFLSDLGDVVATCGADGTPRVTFVHGPDEDDVLAAERDGESFFYHYDLVRSVTAITGPQGELAASYAYGAFGETLRAEGPAADWNPYRYTSREAEAGGLYHYRARTYAPELGRFTTPDPLGVLGGLNAYAYVENDPTQFNDPSGLKKSWWRRAWEKTKSAVTSTVKFVKAAGTALVDDIKEGNLGRNLVAFGKGFGKGLWSGAKGLYTLVRHPVQTVSAIGYAVGDLLQNGRNGAVYKALAAKVEEYKNAALNDPERFWEMTGQLSGELAFSIAGTKGLDKLAKVGKIGAVAAATKVAPTANRVVAPVVNATRRVATTANRYVPAPVRRTVERGMRLSRARTAELARRARLLDEAAEAARSAGRVRNLARNNVFTRNGRRVANLARDTRRYASMARRSPGATLVYTGDRIARGAGRLVASTGRGLWTTTRRYGIPLSIAFRDQITDAIERWETREDAIREITGLGERLLRDAPRLDGPTMKSRLEEVGQAYADYRNRLFAPIHEASLHLDDQLAALEENLDDEDSDAVYARMDAAFDQFTKRRLAIMKTVYTGHAEEEHSMFNPSSNRLLAYMDEIDLLKAVLERTRDPEAKREVEERIAFLEGRMEEENELFLQGEHEALMAGIAGVPRAGETIEEGEGDPLEGLIDPAELGANAGR